MRLIPAAKIDFDLIRKFNLTTAMFESGFSRSIEFTGQRFGLGFAAGDFPARYRQAALKLNHLEALQTQVAWPFGWLKLHYATPVFLNRFENASEPVRSANLYHFLEIANLAFSSGYGRKSCSTIPAR